MAETAGAPTAPEVDAAGDYDEQDILIEMSDLDDIVCDLTDLECQFIGLDTEKPVLRVADRVYEGEWLPVFGTGLLFDKQLTHQASVTKKLRFTRVLPLDIKNMRNNKPLGPEDKNIIQNTAGTAPPTERSVSPERGDASYFTREVALKRLYDEMEGGMGEENAGDLEDAFMGPKRRKPTGGAKPAPAQEKDDRTRDDKAKRAH